MSDKAKKVDKPGAGSGGEETGRITINDIARLSGVSKKTVSRVLNEHPLVNEDTRKRIKQIIAEHGYRPDPQARGLALRRSFLVALAYDNPSPQYVVNMQRGILDTFESTDYQLVLHPVDRGSDNYIDRMKWFVESHRPAGIIMPPSVSEDSELAELLKRLDCPYIRIASYVLDELPYIVRTHDAEGSAQAARHLASLGHTKIAHIHGPKTFRSAHERMSGFISGLSEFGLELSPGLTVEAGYTFESGERAASQLLSGRMRPTAIFAGNDEMAIGIYAAARKAGLSIPDDLSVVGFDDTPMADRITPRLTTVRLPIREMGREAAIKLLRNLAGNPKSTISEFQPEIIVRDSTSSGSSKITT